MNAVKLSPKYQVVIPRDVRENLNLIPGQMMQVIAYGNRIELMPSKDIREMRGFLKGIDTAVSRKDDRL
jgi:AbrB family looped-hinge helix DNA binding protein